MIRLRGITWNHTRGFTPLVACAQRFAEQFPDVEVTWQRRSLLEFGETPVEQLASQFDLLVIDHPFIGQAASAGIFQPLDALVNPGALLDWRTHSVGASACSYEYAGRMWAAPIDSACPVALWRPDLLAAQGTSAPRNWDELLTFAAQRQVLIPGVHTDAIHHFYMLCLALGAEPGLEEERLVPSGLAQRALEELAWLYALVPERCWTMNPIEVHEALAAQNAAQAYCPFAFGYSNYSRRGYAAHRLQAGLPPPWMGQRMRTSLGGTGLAISRGCHDSGWAARFVEFVAASETQGGLYWQSGGQPAHRLAWLDSENSAGAENYLMATLPALDAAWLRPRFPGYLHFQDRAAPVVHAAVCRRALIPESVEKIDALWREARQLRKNHET